MKLFLLYLGALVTATALAVGVGFQPTQQRWGAAGLASLWAAAAICLSAATIAGVLLAVVAVRYPSYLPQAALGGSAVRLFVTGALALVYQMRSDVQLTSFLMWLVILYLLLLTVEVILNVALTRPRRPALSGGGR